MLNISRDSAENEELSRNHSCPNIRITDSEQYFDTNLTTSASIDSFEMSDALISQSENSTIGLNVSLSPTPSRLTPCPTCPEMLKSPLAIILVGLPAHGKTYLATRLCGYLHWIGCKTKVFNFGEYRRKHVGRQTAEFFDPDNEVAKSLRMDFVRKALDDAMSYIHNESGEIVILDATNSTRERRTIISECLDKHGVDKLFIELISDDEDIVKENIKNVKVNSVDYKDTDPDEAWRDFMKRLENYKRAYEGMSEVLDKHLAFIKFINMGERVQTNRIRGTVHSRIVYFLMNLNIRTQRAIYITRHGESEYNESQKLGGNAPLSERGVEYSVKLKEFFDNIDLKDDFEVWTSHMVRTKQTAIHLEDKYCVVSWTALNEIDAGIGDGMTYEEFQGLYPKDFELRKKNKLKYRYPMGESYEDVVMRLEPLIMELERRENDILIICHQAVMRCIMAYLSHAALDDMPHMRCDLHTVVKIVPGAYKNTISKFKIDANPNKT
ncbi:6-phosphofructo-2-kinase/fructose-2,6-bisphosphatase 1 isoform X4 [Oopsacas minuta]|uniref:6-phosphofructo-2-kinase/fructose-2, 6-bisphosphatase 1 isoform X4 n=1 Tax=Oopsacas minuta TaxID=111878 RepID=A0AAV7JLM6_9METZ|nr:6-phosphofructo-2-kinase/fructose-2,6-bisphosphatase 1 isoform X4 [Oopsacas minuta]